MSTVDCCMYYECLHSYIPTGTRRCVTGALSGGNPWATFQGVPRPNATRLALSYLHKTVVNHPPNYSFSQKLVSDVRATVKTFEGSTFEPSATGIQPNESV